MIEAARATCDFYIERPPAPTACPTGTPARPDWRRSATGAAAPSDPFNDHEPVDSSAAAIAAQGLLRLGHFLDARADDGSRYWQAGLRVADTLFDDGRTVSEPGSGHQGLLLHSVYHWPNGWDHVPPGARMPRGESSQWGDYHAREVALYLSGSRRIDRTRIFRSATHD